MVAVREVVEEGGIRTNHLRKVLPRGGPGGAIIWVDNLGVDVSDAAKNLGGTREFHAAGDKDGGLEDGGRDLVKGGGEYRAPDGREKPSFGIYQQEEGDGSGVCGPTYNI